ncbi:MAG: hypothetical protein M5U07_08930 [Xanthobacteraceae bacterium]|nr:hypothetical protein [Xanthobacteraceae bacterium]
MKIADQMMRFRVTDGQGFRLAEHDTAETCGLDKDHAQSLLADGVKRLAELQEKLYAQDRWSVLAIFQAMDAAGKDGAIKHVMSGINPQGCQVFSFKAPSEKELDHDFMWRTTQCLPERGRIGIFNRSYYEEVLVVRARPELLARQKLPRELVTERIWSERFEDIRAFERYLARNGTIIRPFSPPPPAAAPPPPPAAGGGGGGAGGAPRPPPGGGGGGGGGRGPRGGQPPPPPPPAPPGGGGRGGGEVRPPPPGGAPLVAPLAKRDLRFPKVTGPALADLEKARKRLEAEAPRRKRS